MELQDPEIEVWDRFVLKMWYDALRCVEDSAQEQLNKALLVACGALIGRPA